MDYLSSKYISIFASGFKSERYLKNEFTKDIRLICKNLYDQNQNYILSCITSSRSKQLHYNIFCTHTLVSTLFLLHLLFDCFATESYTEEGNLLLLSFAKIVHFYKPLRDGMLYCATSTLNLYQPTIGLGSAYFTQLHSGLIYINNELNPVTENENATHLYNKLVISSVAYGRSYQMIKDRPSSDCHLANYVNQYPYDLPIIIPLNTIKFDVVGILLSNIILAGHVAKIFVTKLNLKNHTKNCTNFFYSLQPLTNYLPTLVDYFGICGSILSIDPIETIPLLTISAKNVAAQPKAVRILKETEKLNQVLTKLTNRPNRPKNPNRNNYLCLVILFLGLLSNVIYTNIKSKKLLMYNTKQTVDRNDTHMVVGSLTLTIVGFVLHFILQVGTNKSKNQKMLESTYSKHTFN